MRVSTLIVEDEPLARQTLRDFSGECSWLEIVGEAADGATAVRLIDDLKPRLVFLDVQMPEFSGLEVLRRAAYRPAVVFTTAFDDYAVRAFELEAFDYLLKPFGRARFRETLGRVRRRLEDKNAASLDEPVVQPERENEPLTRLFVRVRDAIVPLKIDDVSRFEADDDYVKVYAGNRSYLINQTLGAIEARLDRARFCRVHRSMIVNLEFVERVETQDRRLLLILKDKTEILASRSGSQIFRKLVF